MLKIDLDSPNLILYCIDGKLCLTHQEFYKFSTILYDFVQQPEKKIYLSVRYTKENMIIISKLLKYAFFHPSKVNINNLNLLNYLKLYKLSLIMELTEIANFYDIKIIFELLTNYIALFFKEHNFLQLQNEFGPNIRELYLKQIDKWLT